MSPACRAESHFNPARTKQKSGGEPNPITKQQRMGPTHPLRSHSQTQA
jgi:hypothetical protein